MDRRLWVVGVVVAGLMLNGCGDGDDIAAPSDAIAPPTTMLAPVDTDAGAIPTTLPSGPNPSIHVSVAETVPPTLDLSGVTPASIPMVISEHLNSVQQAVRTEVGEDTFAGSAFTNDANDEMTIYGTDPAAIDAALDRFDTPLRDRITVAHVRYSLNEIETYAEQARARLDAAGIAASAGVRFGVDAVVVQLETQDGEPDDTIQTEATNVLVDIPVSISFSRPLVNL